jgi:hypothetical protein
VSWLGGGSPHIDQLSGQLSLLQWPNVAGGPAMVFTQLVHHHQVSGVGEATGNPV